MAMGVMPTRSATGRIAIAARPSRSRISRAAARIRTAVSVFAGAGIEDAIMSIRRTHERVYAVYPAPCNRARYRCYRSGLSPSDELTGSQFPLTGDVTTFRVAIFAFFEPLMELADVLLGM